MVTDNKYVWTEREQHEDFVVCDDCGAENDLSRLYCENCDLMLIETDEDLNDEFIANRSAQRVGKSPEARAEQNGRFFDKLIWFVRNWIWSLLLSVMMVVFHIGLFGGIVALMWWEMGGVSIYPAAVLLGVAFVTLLVFGLLKYYGFFDWLYCESAF